MPTMIGEYDSQIQGELKARREQPPQHGKTLNRETAALRIDHMNASGAGATRIDFERIIGTNDLLQINYLERGMRAARSVARLHVKVPGGDGHWGTGFLVAPGLLMTNCHVVGSPQEALNTQVQFGAEFTADGDLLPGVTFRCEPQRGFICDKELDFAIVAVADRSENGDHELAEYGFLRLDPQTHKVTEDEFVTIIQHPEGREKQIALRENRMLKIGDVAGSRKDNLLWYSSDTAPGSSGAPVMNDQWQVLALHHAAVPELAGEGVTQQIRMADQSWKLLNEVVSDGMSLDQWASEKHNADRLHWIANEGIRISRLIARLTILYGKDGAQKSLLIQALLDDAHGVRLFPGTTARKSVNVLDMPFQSHSVVLPVVSVGTAEPVQERARAPRQRIRDLSYYDGREGYDPHFLGATIPLPHLTERALHFGRPAPVRGADDNVLRYIHFSVVMNADRRLAFFTAVNIDGTRTVRITRGRDEWYYDPRLAPEHQIGDELYSNEPDGNWFDRGHLVRRQDPIWGERALAALANEDTFHWTNASPQYWEFNQSEQLWLGLENFILFNTDADDLRASVFTGPLFGDNDELHRGIRLPQFFWKVVAVRDRAGKLFSSAYMVSQKRFTQNIAFERTPVGPFRSFQVSVAQLEERSGLRFAEAVRNADVFGPDRDDKPLRGLSDIVHPRR